MISITFCQSLYSLLILAVLFHPAYLIDSNQSDIQFSEKDPLVYIDDNGEMQKIQDPSEEFYYKRIHTVKLEGSTGDTVYWVNLYMGTPPQRQTAIIDTGSSLLAFPCSQCQNNCGKHINKQYNLTESNSAQKMTCNAKFDNFNCQKCDDNICSWGVSYMEGSSIGGFMAVDYIVFGDEIQDFLEAKVNKTLSEEDENEYMKFMNHERVQLPFGCTTRETHLFKTQVPDGIIGLAPSSNSYNSPPNIIDRIFAQHKDNQEQLVFSLCLNSLEGGYMSVGGYNHELHLPNAETQILSYSAHSNFYDVNVKQVRIGSKVITTYIPNSILDSGTTLVFGPAAFIDPLIKEINILCKSSQYKCGNGKDYSNSQIKWPYRQSEEFPTIEDFFNSFPVLQFDFADGITIDWKAHGYLYIDPENKDPNLFQFAFETYPSNKVYLGGPFFKNYDILFDKNKHKIHFTPSNCTLPHVNSVLMNTHTSKIRKTMMDVQFIDELKEFQKTFNYTKGLFSNTTDTQQNKTKGEDKTVPVEISPIKKYEKFYKYIIFLLFLLISLVIIFLCKKPSSSDDKNLIPLQTMDPNSGHDDSHIQDIPKDRDEQLKSEEDNNYGYKNDPVYQPNELNKDDEENQKSSPSQNPSIISDEEKERYKALQE